MLALSVLACRPRLAPAYSHDSVVLALLLVPAGEEAAEIFGVLKSSRMIVAAFVYGTT